MIKDIKKIFDFHINKKDGIIKVKENKNIYNVCIYEVEPLTIYDFNEELKCKIIGAYKEFLKEINFEIKILIQSRKLNVEKYIKKYVLNEKINKNSSKEEYIKDINDMLTKAKVYNKKIYISILCKNEYIEKLSEVDDIIYKLSKIGLNVNRIINKNILNNILYSFINKINTKKTIEYMESQDIIPEIIDTRDFKNIKIGENYVSNILISKYPEEIAFCEVFENIPKKEEFDIVVSIEKKDITKTLNEITHSISSFSTEIFTSSKNQIDVDVLKKADKDARLLRKEIQVNNEEVFELNVLFSFFDNNTLKLYQRVKNFQSNLFSKGITSNVLNFRQFEGYKSSLPLFSISSQIKKNSTIMTTTAITNMFCLYTRTTFDENGILIGNIFNENAICNIDIFNEKYINSNMCILGSSGSGKSYFVKLLIIRNINKNINQYIFDPEGEYKFISDFFKTRYINFDINQKDQFYNILELKEDKINDSLEESIIKKAESILKLIESFIKLTKVQKVKIIKAIIKSYGNYNVESIYSKNNPKKIYIEKTRIPNSKFPTLHTVIENIEENELKNKIDKYIIKKYPCITNITTIRNSSTTIFNMKNLSIRERNIFTNYFLEEIEEELNVQCENNENHTIIYFDEIFKYLEKDDNTITNKIFSMYKTIRKKRASIVTITQDIGDFFTTSGGNYGKAVMNNSNFKFFFRLSYIDTNVMKDISFINEKLLLKIQALPKSKVILNFLDNNILIDIVSGKYEKKIIEGGFNEDSSSIEQ
ncbi:MAG: DUF87 domain-containing protein [Clostridia bacterium]